MKARNLLAVGDLHVAYAENRSFVEGFRPRSEEDWLIVAGDIGERIEDITWALTLLAGRFAQVIRAPGNHELRTPRDGPIQPARSILPTSERAS